MTYFAWGGTDEGLRLFIPINTHCSPIDLVKCRLDWTQEQSMQVVDTNFRDLLLPHDSARLATALTHVQRMAAFHP